MSLADLAGGLEGFLLPALQNLAGFMKGGLASAMTFISAHPLLITIGLLAAAFVLLWMNSETFREIVIGVFNAVGRVAKDVFGATLTWIVDRWQDLIGFFQGLPGRIGAAMSGLAQGIGDVFKGALNIVIAYLNFWVDRVNDIVRGINLINPFEDVPSLPRISRLHSGGVFHSGSGGGEGLALLRDGERVTAPGQGGSGGGEWRVSGTGALAELIQYMFATGQIEPVFR